MVDELIKRRVEEAHELDFGHRPQSRDGHSHGHAHNTGFGNRRIHHARPPVAGLQAFGDPKNTALPTDVLTKQNDAFICVQFRMQRISDGFKKGACRHAGQAFG